MNKERLQREWAPKSQFKQFVLGGMGKVGGAGGREGMGTGIGI